MKLPHVYSPVVMEPLTRSGGELKDLIASKWTATSFAIKSRTSVLRPATGMFACGRTVRAEMGANAIIQMEAKTATEVMRRIIFPLNIKNYFQSYLECGPSLRDGPVCSDPFDQVRSVGSALESQTRPELQLTHRSCTRDLAKVISRCADRNGHPCTWRIVVGPIEDIRAFGTKAKFESLPKTEVTRHCEIDRLVAGSC